MAEGATLADLGEWELISRLGAFAPPGQFSDDSAILASSRDNALVINTDVLVEGVHFSDRTTSPSDTGWRAAVANLSDLAAMGCTDVVGLTVGLVAPGSTPWAWVEGVYRGVQQALQTYGGVILGGDCSGGVQRMLAVTAIGRLGKPERGAARGGPIRRKDGRPGDLLVCTGPHGLSRLGLALLQDPAGPLAKNLPPSLQQRAIQAHQRPVPRLDAVAALIGSLPEGMAWRVGGCDSSDGLAAAVAAVAAGSGCSAELQRSALPLDPAMAVLPQAEAWCLTGGEDFELVLAVEPAWAEALLEVLPGSSLIGQLVTGEAGALGWGDGGAWPHEGARSGYSHFS